MFTMDSKIPKPSFLRKPAGPMSLPGNARLPLSRDLLNLPSANSTMFSKVRAASPEQRSNGVLNRAKLRRSRSATDLNRPDFHRPKYVTNLGTIPSRTVNISAATIAMMASSDLVKSVHGDGFKNGPSQHHHLRRSRSACDIAMKSNVSTASSTTTSSSTSGPKPLAGIKRQPVAAVTISRNYNGPAKVAKIDTARVGAVGVARNVAQKPAVSVPPAATARKPMQLPKTIVGTNAATGSKTGGPNGTKPSGTAKTMTKRIPPYDYKARFAQLHEKHKALQAKYEKLTEDHASRESLQEQYQDCVSELEELKTQYQAVTSEFKATSEENRELKLTSQKLSAALQDTEAELDKYKVKFTTTHEENRELKKQLRELEERSAFLEEENVTLQYTNQRNAELLFQANIERKDLHNMVMDLRGNIRVFCRVRPPLASELHRVECGWKYLDEQSLELAAMDGTNKRIDFSFDHVFHPRTTQQDIFDNVSPLIQSALDGYNVCIFAYGQTGSGKTYTMDGVPEDLGVIPRTVDLIFNAINDYKRFGWEYEIRVTFLEIYNEILYDLLDTSGTTKDLEIRMANAKNKTEVYVSNIIEETVDSTGRLHQLMAIAKMNRATAATAGNERSSRSHAVTKITLIGTHQDKGETCVGSVNLVDLAGSESPKTSTRMDETKNINRSLSELSNVILALVQRNEHIPYRNSKLTHLLMPSLGGNSKTLMFVNVAPFQDCFTETVKSLRFASQVNSCKMQKVRKNKVLNSSSVV
ncbi:protein claret segregational [Anopheles ziemanni]|uniref:protein claret segregational n=1 Tax=Anopheles coustani TaxID=139045 RepID=UPI00265A2ABC|nr:protein claret segregational [Anopheles coustani]XP_058128752.1 protein claret segregational [Anopheles coustani]XP_058175409.1 protein claret segregational [Anopheles ziemanni]